MAAGQGAADAGLAARAGSPPDFRVYSTDDQIANARFYFIESTAPDSVELQFDPGGKPPNGLTRVDPDAAVKEIAETLTPRHDPQVDANLVVMVHGFNTPRDRALEFYAKALDALVRDQNNLFRNPARRTVCIGYRWPSEQIGSVLWSSVSALPVFPLIILAASAVAIAICLWIAAAALKIVGIVETEYIRVLLTIFAVVCGLLILAIAVMALLRAIVYFRDVYRATNYGVPDLVEVIRQIDREAMRRLGELGETPATSQRPRIALSFVGHSMGGLIVTNAIRILSDVFGKDVIRTCLSGRLRPEMARREAEGEDDSVPGRIGHVFTLTRFVLVSPDIPAEALLADRANFLASSLRRFHEAYLFSNEGDEVLRAISTGVNYFTFPTLNRVYGYRLGNVEILASNFGETPPGRNSLDILRAGTKTLSYLSGMTTRRQRPTEVTRAFTFFDCTDYIDGTPPKGMLTEALNFKRNDPNAAIPPWEQLKLLILYIAGRVDVHGGYFDGEVAQRLMYRLACLGFDQSLTAYGGEDAMLGECRPSDSGHAVEPAADSHAKAARGHGPLRPSRIGRSGLPGAVAQGWRSSDRPPLLAQARQRRCGDLFRERLIGHGAREEDAARQLGDQRPGRLARKPAAEARRDLLGDPLELGLVFGANAFVRARDFGGQARNRAAAGDVAPMRAAEIIGREGVEPFVAVAALETLDAEAQPLDPRRDHGAERRRLGAEMGVERA
jgi:hypothetical protein